MQQCCIKYSTSKELAVELSFGTRISRSSFFPKKVFSVMPKSSGRDIPNLFRESYLVCKFLLLIYLDPGGLYEFLVWKMAIGVPTGFTFTPA
jgi:hypothetical protein